MNKVLKASNEEHSEQREQSVQRPWGRTGPGVRGREGGGEGRRGKGQVRGGGLLEDSGFTWREAGAGGLWAEEGAGPDSRAHGLPLAVVGRKDCEE